MKCMDIFKIMLFNDYSEKIAKHHTLICMRFKINCERIVSCANDKVLIGEKIPEKLQRLVSRLETESEKCGMKINVSKEKMIIIARME